MRDLKIKPGMDTPKAKLKNPAPKDADSILKKHMDKRQQEKEPESRDPVRYATDRVEKNMRHGASGAADASRRMIKHYRGKLRQGKENAAREYRVADMGIGAESGSANAPTEYDFSPAQTTARNKVGKQTFSPQNPNAAKNASAAPQERGRQKAVRDAKAAYGRNLAEKRTAERHIVPPPSDRGGTMTTPQKGNSGVSANYSQKTIYLSDASATLHEFGHFLDWTLGIPAKHERLYLAEAQNSGLRDYAKTNAREYFADCFDYWIAYSGSEKRMETFRNAAPQTWAYFEALEKNNWRG